MRSKTFLLCALTLAVNLSTLPSRGQVKGDLEVKVSPGRGETIYLYNSIRSFRQDHHGEKACLSAPGPEATFKDLPMGDYGVKLFRNLNSKNKHKISRIPIKVISDGQQQVGVPYSGRWEKNHFHMGRETLHLKVQIKSKHGT